MADQHLHGGVEAVALLELDREAFGEVARRDAGGLEGLHDGEHRLDLGERRAELFGNGREVAGQIPGLVDQIDQVLADHAADRIGDREQKLVGEMAGERGLGRDERLEIIVAVVAPAGADAGPFRIGGRLGRRVVARGWRRAGVLGKHVV